MPAPPERVRPGSQSHSDNVPGQLSVQAILSCTLRTAYSYPMLLESRPSLWQLQATDTGSQLHLHQAAIGRQQYLHMAVFVGG